MVRFGDVQDPASLANESPRGERFDALVSCLASRSGAPRDAWAIDHRANMLAFQHAKLAAEKALMASGMAYSIVRSTAFFKPLSGQVKRVRRGKPFLVFGDGTLTACKPISDDDLAGYLADCLDNTTRYNRVLPIGGPGGAITPRQQGERLFALLGRAPRFRQVPVACLDAIIGGLSLLGHALPALAASSRASGATTPPNRCS